MVAGFEGMQVCVISITAIAPASGRSDAFGQYRVTLKVGDREQALIYTIKLSPREQSASWTPSDNVLSDPRVDVLAVAGVTDVVVAFHRGEAIKFPRVI